VLLVLWRVSHVLVVVRELWLVHYWVMAGEVLANLF